jgi:hypothetical protein
VKDPTLPLQQAVAAAIVTELTTQGYSSPALRVLVDPEPGQTLPYVVLNSASVIPFGTKTTEGGECTYTVTCWAKTHTEAQQMADYSMQAMTSRTTPLAPTGYDCAGAFLDFRGPPLREAAPGTDSGWYWGVPVRVRYRLVEQ